VDVIVVPLSPAANVDRALSRRRARAHAELNESPEVRRASMSRLILCACLACMSATACRDATPPTAPSAAPSGPGDQIEWQGLRACADCNGIQTDLVLERGGDKQRYTLTETYVTERGSTQFVERGRWQQDSHLLRLLGDGASRHVYALLPDGRLQARDSHGLRLAAATSQELLPVGYATSE
jgi:copper homeostasis protein (lipoprotein)